MEIIEAKGDYTQAGSGMVFPEKVADFERVVMIRYNGDNEHISARYERQGAEKMNAVVFVHPDRKPSAEDPFYDMFKDAPEVVNLFVCTEELIAATQPLIDKYKGKVTFKKPEDKEFGGKKLISGSRSVEYDNPPGYFGNEKRVRSDVTVHCRIKDHWTIKIIFDSRPEIDATAAIKSFNDNLKWTFKD